MDNIEFTLPSDNYFAWTEKHELWAGWLRDEVVYVIQNHLTSVGYHALSPICKPVFNAMTDLGFAGRDDATLRIIVDDIGFVDPTLVLMIQVALNDALGFGCKWRVCFFEADPSDSLSIHFDHIVAGRDGASLGDTCASAVRKWAIRRATARWDSPSLGYTSRLIQHAIEVCRRRLSTIKMHARMVLFACSSPEAVPPSWSLCLASIQDQRDLTRVDWRIGSTATLGLACQRGFRFSFNAMTGHVLNDLICDDFAVRVVEYITSSDPAFHKHFLFPPKSCEAAGEIVAPEMVSDSKLHSIYPNPFLSRVLERLQ